MTVVLVIISTVDTPEEVAKAWETLRSHATDRLSVLVTRRDQIEKRLAAVDGALNALRARVAFLRKKSDRRMTPR
jgi:hypothetical protein